MASIDITGGAGGGARAPRGHATAAAFAERVLDPLAEQIKPLFLHFLNTFVLPQSGSSRAAAGGGTSETGATAVGKYYVARAHQMVKTDDTTLRIDFSHMELDSAALASTIREKFYQLLPALCAVVEQFLQTHAPEHPKHRPGAINVFRPSFYNLPIQSQIRDLKTSRIGELMCISGTVTRTSAVRPELSFGTFRCMDCRTINANILQQFKYTEPTHCLNPVCENRTKWALDTTLSSFQDWQLVRIQENSSEIPAGSMPRSMKIVLRDTEVEKTKPGEKCVFTGTLIVVPDVAQLGTAAGSSAGKKFRGAGGGQGRSGGANENLGGGVTGAKELGVRDLTYSLCFLASNVAENSTNAGEVALDAHGNPVPEQISFTPAEEDRINEMRAQGRLYTRMVASIAPNIFGHDEIKRGILLMLLGGVHKKTSDGQNLRGDINVCVVGDPSTSKSQFLKYVCTFLPRAVYTSGKASSAAGLTASVARDPESGEFVIEAGALMLADNGICCIDEFDKMEPTDQVAIHEAMEQQTISISKAGIQATLNARTSILAAANPIKGRYDPSRTLKQNVDISAPIMSRFDLFFVVLDEGDQAIDYNIARHIVNVHTGKASYNRPEYTLEDLQLYIRYARTKKPRISEEARADFIANYCALRGADSTGTNKSAYRITVRQLESMVRLAEARARLDLEDEVTAAHVREAARLLKKSIVHVENRDIDLAADEGEEEYDFGAYPNGDDDGDDDMNGGGAPARMRSKAGVVGARKLSKPISSTSAEGEEESKSAPLTETEPMETDDAPAAPTSNGTANTNAGVRAGAGSKKSATLSFHEYQRLTLLITRFLRSRETEENPSMSWAELVNTFIAENIGGEAPKSEEELIAQTTTLEAVITRLIRTDHILLLLKKSKSKEKRMLRVHPNFVGDADAIAAMGQPKAFQQASPMEGAPNPEADADEALLEASRALRAQHQASEAAEQKRREEEVTQAQAPQRGGSTASQRSTRSTQSRK